MVHAKRKRTGSEPPVKFNFVKPTPLTVEKPIPIVREGIPVSDYFTQTFTLPTCDIITVDYEGLSDQVLHAEIALLLPRIPARKLFEESGVVLACDWKYDSYRELRMYANASRNLVNSLKYIEITCKDWISPHCRRLINEFALRIQKRVLTLNRDSLLEEK